MSETEVERLVVRLTGEGSDYQRMLAQAQTSTTETAHRVEQAAGRIEGITKSMGSFVAGAVSALSALGLGSWLREGLGEWQTAESTALKLEAALRSNGRAVESTMESYRNFASELQEVTVIGDDTTLAMLRQAETFNVTGDAAQRAVQDAIALQASATGSAEGAESLIRLTAALTQGNVEQAMQFARMVPQLRGITNESEFLARAQRLIAGGMATARAEATSSAGTMKQLKNAYGDLMEEVGKTVAEVIAPIIAGVRRVVKWFQDLSPAVKEAIVVMAILTASAIALFVAVNTGMVVFNMLSGGVLLVIGLIITASAAIAGWVVSIGGVQKAWGRVKEAAMVAWKWIKSYWPLLLIAVAGPIGAAVVLIVKYWDQIKAVATATWNWVKDKGGQAFDYIKGKFNEFVTWAYPIWNAIKGVAEAVWERVTIAASDAWDFIKMAATATWEWIQDAFTNIQNFIISVWQSIFGESTTTWNDIRLGILEALIFAEFALRNFGSVAALVWAGAKLKFVQFVSVVTHFFTGVVPAVLNYFASNWRAIFLDAFNLAAAGFRNLLGNVASIGRNIPRLLSGQVSLANIWTPLQTGFQRTAGQLVIPQRVISENERRLQEEFDSMQANLRGRWEDFRRRRMAEVFQIPEDQVEAATATIERNNPMSPVLERAREVTAEIQRWDAAARFSAEGFARITEYLDRIGATPAAGGRASGSAPARSSPSAVFQPSAREQSRPGDNNAIGWQRIATLLGTTNGLLERIANQPGARLREG